MWQISKRITRKPGGLYVVATRVGMLAYIHDDHGNLVPANGVSALVG